MRKFLFGLDSALLDPSRFIKLSFSGFLSSLISSAVILVWAGPDFYEEFYGFLLTLTGIENTASDSLSESTLHSNLWTILAFHFLMGTLLIPLLYSFIPKMRGFYMNVIKGTLFGLLLSLLINYSEVLKDSNLETKFTSVLVLHILYGFSLGFFEVLFEKTRTRGKNFLP